MHMRSFNPCCIGLGIQTGCVRRLAYWPQVSILVVLDWVFKRKRFIWKPDFQNVSILVVLDWVFKQSYLAGCEWGWERVSILVVLDWVFKPAGCVVVPGVTPEFQSLLYWIGYSNRLLPHKARLTNRCFNPCCIGLGIQTMRLFGALHAGNCFNPCCIGLGIQTMRMVQSTCRPLKRFNPCCIGLGIQTP